jgi:hypothetical protein
VPSLAELLQNKPVVFTSVDHFLRHFPDSIAPSPSLAESRSFIDLAKNRCTVRPQQTAIFQISRLALISGPSSFPRLDRKLLCYQLIRRIMNPNLFEQGLFGLCGPAAFSVAECRADPVAFASFAVQLFETGRGMLKGRQIDPARQIREFNPQGIKEADFFILASVRDSTAALTNTTNFAAYDGTGLEWMFDWFVQAGYSRVLMIMTPPHSGSVLKFVYTVASAVHKKWFMKSHPDIPGVFSVQGLNPKNLEDVLRTACFYSQMGWKIAVAGSANIAHAAGEYARASRAQAEGAPAQLVAKFEEQALKKLKAEAEDHWMLAEHIQITGGLLHIRLWSWAQHFETTQMPVAAFLEVFSGFVAALPVPVLHHPAIPDPF